MFLDIGILVISKNYFKSLLYFSPLSLVPNHTSNTFIFLTYFSLLTLSLTYFSLLNSNWKIYLAVSIRTWHDIPYILIMSKYSITFLFINLWKKFFKKKIRFCIKKIDMCFYLTILNIRCVTKDLSDVSKNLVYHIFSPLFKNSIVLFSISNTFLV